tara:strand:- start:358 stop:618 length:261 start_codon:yes stop_codon:yes gene_type:complete
MIREWYGMFDPEPAVVNRDSRGVLIEEGLKVAYNQSGNVVLGVIKKFKCSEWSATKSGWRLKFILLIENEEGQLSKVKNPNSFVVI